MTEIVFHHAPPTRRSFNKSLWFPHNKLKRLLCPHNQTSRTRMSRRGNLHCSLNWISLPVFYRGAKALRSVLEDISVVSFLLSQCVGEYLLIMKEFTVQAIFFPYYFCPPKEGRTVYFCAFCEYIVTQKKKHAFLSRWKLKLAKGFRSICLDLELLWDQDGFLKCLSLWTDAQTACGCILPLLSLWESTAWDIKACEYFTKKPKTKWGGDWEWNICT